MNIDIYGNTTDDYIEAIYTAINVIEESTSDKKNTIETLKELIESIKEKGG